MPVIFFSVNFYGLHEFMYYKAQNNSEISLKLLNTSKRLLHKSNLLISVWTFPFDWYVCFTLDFVLHSTQKMLQRFMIQTKIHILAHLFSGYNLLTFSFSKPVFLRRRTSKGEGRRLESDDIEAPQFSVLTQSPFVNGHLPKIHRDFWKNYLSLVN